MQKTDSSVCCRKHWSAFIPTAIISLAVAWVGIAAGTSANNPGTVAGCLVIAAALLGVDILATGRITLSISPNGVVGRTGLLHSAKITAPISRVQDVTVDNGILGKLLRFHTITVTTAGTDGKEFVFKGFTNGPKFQQTFLRLAA